MPLIEQTSLARKTTAWVLDNALRQLAVWQARGLELVLSVNVSAESAVMNDGDNALLQLKKLGDAGIRLAIDDFGTGYSSLAYLQRLPAHIVKTDRSFIANLEGGDKEQGLVRSMITLSHDLGYRVVGEGVETAEINQKLLQLGCDEAKGYFIARLMEAGKVEAWMATHRRSAFAVAS